MAELDRHIGQISTLGANSTELGQLLPGLCEIWPGIGPILAKLGLGSTKFGPNAFQIGSTRAAETILTLGAH